jgi:hypothetical protein
VIIALSIALVETGIPRLIGLFQTEDTKPSVTASLYFGGCSWLYTKANIASADKSTQENLLSTGGNGDFTFAAIRRGSDGVVLSVTLQTTSKDPIIINNVRFNIRRSRVAHNGSIYNPGGCGAGMAVRPFLVNMDSPTPSLKSLPGTDEEGSPLPPLKFPFKISSSDPESFEFRFESKIYYTEFTAAFDWSSPSGSGKITINNHGKNFKLMGTGDLPIYMLGDSQKLILDRNQRAIS